MYIGAAPLTLSLQTALVYDCEVSYVAGRQILQCKGLALAPGIYVVWTKVWRNTMCMGGFCGLRCPSAYRHALPSPCGRIELVLPGR